MRTNLLTGERTAKTKTWHESQTLSPSPSSAPCKSWSEYTPYSNVIWIGYILGYLKKALKKTSSTSTRNMKGKKGNGKGSNDVLALFNEETKGLTGKLDFRTKIANGAFGTATEVLLYCVERGWVSEVQAEEYGADVSGVF